MIAPSTTDRLLRAARPGPSPAGAHPPSIPDPTRREVEVVRSIAAVG